MVSQDYWECLYLDMIQYKCVWGIRGKEDMGSCKERKKTAMLHFYSYVFTT